MLYVLNWFKVESSGVILWWQSVPSVPFRKYYQAENIKEDEMSEVYSWWKREMYARFYSENLKDRDTQWGNPDLK
jgi:hypothetical protein